MEYDKNKVHYIVVTGILVKDGKYLIVKRANWEKAFPGKWTVPGGKLVLSEYEHLPKTAPNYPQWYNVVEWVLRKEAQEEVGIIPESVTILGQLSPLFISPSQFLVYPVVGYTTTIPAFIPDPIEIREIIPCSLFDFLESDTLTIRDIEVGGKILPDIPCYQIGERIIWGATAMIFSELLEIIKTINFK